MLARMRESGAYQPSMAWRSSLVTISKVNSSWLRKNVPHWVPAGICGVFSMVETMGSAFWSRSA